MITYKPNAADKEENSELNNDEKAESTSNGSLTSSRSSTTNDDSKKEEGLIEKEDIASAPAESLTSSTKVEQDAEKEAKSKSDRSVEQQPNIEEVAITDTTTHTQTSTTAISEPPARSPVWLDALIGGLVSVLIGLVCRKYIL